ALSRIADGGDALVEQHLQDVAAVEWRAADEEVVGRLTPILFEPFDIGLEAASGCDQRLAAHIALAALIFDRGGDEEAVFDLEPDHRRVVDAGDAECRGPAVERIEHAAAAAEEEGVGL